MIVTPRVVVSSILIFDPSNLRQSLVAQIEIRSDLFKLPNKSFQLKLFNKVPLH